MAFSFITLAVVGPTTQEAKADDPYNPVDDFGDLFPFNAWTDAIWAAITNGLNSNQADASGNAVSNYRQTTAAYYNDTLELAKSTTLNEMQLAQLTTNYYIRRGEMAALHLYQQQKLLGQPFDYDLDAIFIAGGIYDLLNEQYNMATAGYQSVFGTFEQYQARFIGDYSAMNLKIKAGVDTQSGTYGTSSNPVKFELSNKLAANSYYCVDLNEKFTFGGLGDTSSRTWVYTFYDVEGNTIGNYTYSYNISNRIFPQVPIKEIIPGIQNNITPIKYTVSGTDSNLAMLFTKTTPAMTLLSDGGTDVALMILRVSDKQSCGTTFTSGTSTSTIISGSTTGSAASIAIIGDGTSLVEIRPHLLEIKNVYAKIKTLATTVHNYAQTYFNYLVTNGDDGIPYVMPSIMPIDPEQMKDMTMTELYAIYIAYMTALMQGFQNGYTVTPGNVTVSIDSLKLICRGAIYNSTGAVVGDNTTLFTPFPTIADMEISIGTNTMSQAGFLIKWGNSAAISDNISDPSNSSFTPETMTYYNYGVNWTFDIEEIFFEGVPVTSVTLNVTDLETVYADLDGPGEGVDVLNDYEWLLSRWYYFAIVAGIICMVAAIGFRNTSIIIVGLVLIAIGAIGYYLAGDFSILDALNLSITPPNLTAWINNLR